MKDYTWGITDKKFILYLIENNLKISDYRWKITNEW